MKANQTNLYNKVEDDSIDIVVILKKIWCEKILLLKLTLSFFIIGCIVALLSPVKYTSQTTFVPQVISDDMSTTNNRLGSLASLAGINLNPTKINSDSYLSPLLYTNIVDSEEFSLKLLDEELVDSNADKFTVREYGL